MTAAAPARAATMLLPRRAVAITACFLSVLLFAIQVTNAVTCFAAFDASTVPALSAEAPGHGSEGTDDDCEERALFTSSLPKSDDTKQHLVSTWSGFHATALLDYKPLNKATRGVPVRRDKAPLFLQTARLRI